MNDELKDFIRQTIRESMREVLMELISVEPRETFGPLIQFRLKPPYGEMLERFERVALQLESVAGFMERWADESECKYDAAAIKEIKDLCQKIKDS